MKSSNFGMLVIGFALLVTSTKAADEQTPAPNPADHSALEKQFGQKLSHCRLVGFFSIVGQEGPPKHDEYTLGAVTKGEGDKWIFNSSLQFGTKVINVPLEIPVLWAGDTPVISVTDFTIPGMGTYTARVMFYGDEYAGTWNSPKHGGYMWGRVEPAPATQPATNNPAQ
jgi:hypothetical protein